ncbi:PH domain-containing protein [Streptomyces rimosus]|uniref:PH domain-containing protein n=1 Tax=Streptomyces rimosus TaxID=1927 RepID=UPI00067BFECA|nr:PH domain-containing protein [Streptomyces rimosus]
MKTTVDRTEGPAGQATVRLRTPSETASRRAPLFWATRAGLGWAVLLLGQAGWLLNDRIDTVPYLPVPHPQYVLIAVTAVLALLHVSVMPCWRFRVHRWEVAPVAVYTRAGWLNQERRIAPVSRIQTVDTQRGPLASIFGLVSVTVTTASARGPVRIHALDQDVAERLVEELTVQTGQTPGDAT